MVIQTISGRDDIQNPSQLESLFLTTALYRLSVNKKTNRPTNKQIYNNLKKQLLYNLLLL